MYDDLIGELCPLLCRRSYPAVDAKGLCVIDCTTSNCLPRYLQRANAMGLRKSLKKAMAYLLGVVDEYWAMREPSQYGEKDPKCSIPAESQSCVSKSVSH